ncbi:MAG: PKD domain-containing protein [Pseudonocardiaceae bacterium]
MAISWGQRRVLGLVAVAAGLMVFMIASSNASAVLLPLPNGQVVSYQPLRSAANQYRRPDSVFNNMDYNGGPIMPSNTDIMLFWSPKGYTAYGSPGNPPEYVTGIEQYWKGLQHDSGGNQNVDSISTQYGDATGAFARYQVKYGGAILDTNPYPASQCPAPAPVTNCLTDAQIQAEVQAVATANHIPADLQHEIYVITPPHVAGCFTSDAVANYGGCSVGEPPNLAVYCAYHQETVATPMRFYAFDPYVTNFKYGGQLACDSGNYPNGPSDGAIDGGMAHEHNESITDPIPNDAWTNGTGADHGEEVGDQCGYTYGAPLGTVTRDGHTYQYNQVIHGRYYYYQTMWSNDLSQCLQRYTSPGALPAATFTATAGSGLTMNFDASGSGPSFAVYSWLFNDSAPGCTTTCNNTVETTSPAISHTFPLAGMYSVGLAAFQSSGLSAGAGGIINAGHSGFVPGFTDVTKGLKASFQGLSTISLQPVTNYLWEFGDGKTGTSYSPHHVYAKPGTYKVTVVEFSGIGSAYPGSGAAPIYSANVTVS